MGAKTLKPHRPRNCKQLLAGRHACLHIQVPIVILEGVFLNIKHGHNLSGAISVKVKIKIIGADYIISSENHAVPREDWKTLGSGSGEIGRLDMYLSSAYSVHHEYDDEGYITAKYLMSEETSGGSPFM